jgi:hypothetical protein
MLTTRPPKVPEASMLPTRPPKVPEVSMLTTRPPKVPEASMLTTRPQKPLRSYILVHYVKFMPLLGAPYIYDISRLRVKSFIMNCCCIWVYPSKASDNEIKSNEMYCIRCCQMKKYVCKILQQQTLTCRAWFHFMTLFIINHKEFLTRFKVVSCLSMQLLSLFCQARDMLTYNRHAGQTHCCR